MIDHLSTTRRSWNMAQIRGSNTAPEKRLRSLLHRKGFRFVLHDRRLSGKPDIVLPKYKAAIFVHGCFWHRHRGCKNATNPSTRRDFWQEKFSQNVKRDARNRAELRKAGWRVFVIWECKLQADGRETTKELISKIRRRLTRNAS